MMPLRITDYVLQEIADCLGQVPPEQGGALLGVPGADVVTSFIHDADAAATDVRYQNSSWLIAEVERAEQATAARLKGIIHSHPAGLPSPSEQDLTEFGQTLQLNPHLARYLALIVTHDTAAPPGGHEIIWGPARVSCFGASSAANGDI